MSSYEDGSVILRRGKIFARVLLGISILSAYSIVEPLELQAAPQTTRIETSHMSAAEKRARALQEKREIEQQAVTALENNEGRKAEKNKFIPSTRKSVILSFGGLSQREPLKNILDTMKSNQMRGTFFATERELKKYPDNIHLIQSYGQDLAMGLTSIKGGGSSKEYAEQIIRVQKILKKEYGVETNIVRQLAQADNEDAIKEAISAMNCYWVDQGLNVVQSKQKDAKTPEEVMSCIFGNRITSLGRNEIVFIRTDYYTDPDLAAAVMLAIKKDKIDNIAYHEYDRQLNEADKNDSSYQISSIKDVLEDTKYRYEYPVDTSYMSDDMKPDYRQTHITNWNFQEEFLKRYVGAPEITRADRMPGFTKKEVALADKTGLVKTAPPQTVFLTFDDWGHDDSINKILYVLRKHRVHATFFVITKNIDQNPNMLRAIVSEGNEVGSHTDHHVSMFGLDKRGRTYPIEDEKTYRANIRSSYEKLAAVVGDVKIENGTRLALTRLLRLPQLYVSREGSAIALEEGFTYLVSGSGSAEDYGAISMESLEGIMDHIVHKRNGEVRRGAIMIMHMSRTATRTARALDILLTKNDQRPDGDPKKFKVGLLGDYLTGDYDQRMTTPKDMREKPIDF